MVKLANGKATQARRVYLVCDVIFIRSAMVILECFVAQTRGVLFYYLTSNSARGGDNNVVFVSKPGNLFNPSFVKVGLS